MPFYHNQVQLLGRTGDAASYHVLTDGTAVSRLRLYLNPVVAGESPSVFNVVAWDGLALRLHEEVKRGQQLLVQGRLRNRKFVADGVTHVRTEIHLEAYFQVSRQRRHHNPPKSTS